MGPAWPQILVLALLVAGSVHCDSAPSDDNTCAQRSACKCSNTQGLGIDLNSLAALQFLATPMLPSQLTYYFHPCQDMNMQVAGNDNKTLTCESSTLCVRNHTANTLESLGKIATTEFHDSVTHNERFIVVKRTGAEPKTTLIQLGCTNVESDRLFGLPETADTTQINLVLYSPQACVRQLDEIHSLSTGAVLLITLFCLVFAYVVLGMLVNYFLVGARGIEMLPHLSFWRDFPSLVKDGVTFLQNGCNPVPRDELLTPNTPNQDSYVSI